MGAVGWQVGSPPLSLEECVKERATLHFRDGAMVVQSAGMKNDKNLAAHQPRCVPNHSRLAASHAEETTDDMSADQFIYWNASGPPIGTTILMPAAVSRHAPYAKERDALRWQVGNY